MPLRTGRKILGAAAVLLPFDAESKIDWESFESIVGRTVSAGLIPSVNMDTGYVQLLSQPEQQRVLEIAAANAEVFYAGVCVDDEQGDNFNLDSYRRAFDEVAATGATPVIFPSWGLNALDGADWVEALASISNGAEFIGFELGDRFVPYGKIFDLGTYAALMELPNCLGAKHSSLSRELEWDRLRCRDQNRPDFRVFTGNDLGIDMVKYGSDYLLGLAAAAPDAFAARDAMWEAADPAFYELNDQLQYLGAFAFRDPVPAYKHSIARFLWKRGWVSSPNTHPDSPSRPAWEQEILDGIAADLDRYLAAR